jgi:preprotein translocase subunit SecE|tara:strand:- start:301 stop:495 length:195 start_codon:yes stop_codon:yes gene_type:complete
MNKIINYFKGISVELKKVSWLSKEQLLNSTVIVGIFSLIICIFLFILDFGLTQFIKLIFDIEIG